MNIQPYIAGFKKETWEFRKILMWLPIVMAALVVFLPLLQYWTLEEYQWNKIISALSGVSEHTFSEHDISQIKESSFGVIAAIFVPFIAISFIVQLYYLTACLFDERRDLSVYFWRSLPVSDASSVATKLLTGGLLIPIIFMLAATVTLVALIVIGLIISVILASSYSISLWEVWGHISILPNVMKVWISLLPHFLWMLPVYAWFMLASMFAKKAPFLWAVVPIAALVVIDLIAMQMFKFNSYFVIPIIGGYFEITPELLNQHYTEGDVSLMPFMVMMDKVSISGLALAGVMLYLTYWLRVNRSQS